MQELEYKTFDSLMASVEGSGLRKYADSGLILRKDYIKVARFVNSDLGIKLNRQAEVCINVENGRADLPEDLLSIITLIAVSVDTCDFTSTIPDWQSKRLRYFALQPSRKSLSKFSERSPNRWWKKCNYQVDVNDRQMLFNFEQGELYMSYVCDMVDEEGNLLVLDHSLVNPYYESAIRAEIFRNMWYEQDADTYQKYVNEVERVLPPLKQKATGIVAFPGYRKLKENSLRIEKEYQDRFVKIFY